MKLLWLFLLSIPSWCQAEYKRNPYTNQQDYYEGIQSLNERGGSTIAVNTIQFYGSGSKNAPLNLKKIPNSMVDLSTVTIAINSKVSKTGDTMSGGLSNSSWFYSASSMVAGTGMYGNTGRFTYSLDAGSATLKGIFTADTFPTICGTSYGGALTTLEEDGVSYCIHTFKNVGVSSFIPPAGLMGARTLIVGKGGDGGVSAGANWRDGGGGGGQVKEITVPVTSTVTIIVGSNETWGTSSFFGSEEAIVGGEGGNNIHSGLNGACGGGGGSWTGWETGGLGFAGHNGGTSTGGEGDEGSGGGGASEAGEAGTYPFHGGSGGDGVCTEITGIMTCYGGGGAGFRHSGDYAYGGLGGGGDFTTVPSSGAANTGGGGSALQVGGTGIVIVRYALGVPTYFTVLNVKGNADIEHDLIVEGNITGKNLVISSNAYITGFSTAATYYGDGSHLTGVISTTIVIETTANNGTLGVGTAFYAFTAGMPLTLHKLTATIYNNGSAGTSIFRCGSAADYIEVPISGTNSIGERVSTTMEKIIAKNTEVICLMTTSTQEETPTAVLSLQYSHF